MTDFIEQALKIELRPFKEYMEHFNVTDLNKIIRQSEDMLDNKGNYKGLSDQAKEDIKNNVILMSLHLIPLQTWIDVLTTANILTGRKFTDPLEYLEQLGNQTNLADFISYLTLLLVNSKEDKNNDSVHKS